MFCFETNYIKCSYCPGCSWVGLKGRTVLAFLDCAARPHSIQRQWTICVFNYSRAAQLNQTWIRCWSLFNLIHVPTYYKLTVEIRHTSKPSKSMCKAEFWRAVSIFAMLVMSVFTIVESIYRAIDTITMWFGLTQHTLLQVAWTPGIQTHGKQICSALGA